MYLADNLRPWFQGKVEMSKPGSLAFAVRSLREADYAHGTITPRSKDYKVSYQFSKPRVSTKISSALGCY